ncbi:arginine kinase [Cephus cinctus]|uniref:arginine kinase n=1 Tax=Cephus cinctus TaxID=211228 RepID=A0AAJ7C3S0_CEPCN|nr:arginine kinase [Cephus cinctus]
MCDKRLCACRKKAALSKVDPGVIQELEKNFTKFSSTDSSSLLKKYLTRELFDKLKTKKTSYGSTLLDVVQSGFANPDSGVGVYAPDPESYTVFAELFNPIIEDYHGGFEADDVHPPLDWGNPDNLGNLDPDGKYVLSTRVRCGRSLQGYPFNPTMTKTHYQEIQQKVSEALGALEDDLQGTYYPLETMDKKTKEKLIEDHFLFKEGDRFLQAANACRYWPSGRGIFLNADKTFLVWCNEEDHMRIISMQNGADLAAVYGRLIRAVREIEKKFSFARHQRIGFLTFCPSNLGTTIRASVHIKVPRLSADYDKFEEIANMYNLQIRGIHGEHSASEKGVYDISNKRRLGLSENQALIEMRDGIMEIIKQEERLSR